MKRSGFHVLVGASLVALTSAAQASEPAEGAEAAEADIVVTATRRAENAQDVPISITAVTAQDLRTAGISSTRDLALVTPGLRMDQSGTYVQPVIRGVSTVLTASNESNVATYIDNVYQPAVLGAIHELPDVRQVEVLKGPQGTLFGRNATGGAILISTLDPDLADLRGQFQVGYSSFETVSAKAFVSVPLSQDMLALSLSGFYENMQEGYKRNLLGNGRKAWTRTGVIRGKLRYQPAEGIDFVLTALHADRNDHNILVNTNYQGNNAQALVLAARNLPLADEPHEFATDLEPFTRTRISNISLRGTIDAGPGTISLTTSYLRNNQRLLTDGDNSPLGNSAQQVAAVSKTFTQEAIYATDQLGRFRGVIGAFYIDQSAGNAPFWLDVPATGATFVATIWSPDKLRSYAFFGEGTLDLTERLMLTAGLRYSHETKRQDAFLGAGPIRPGNIPLLGKASWSSLDPRVSLLFRANEDLNLYATWSRGFKSGAFNPPLQANPVEPERLDSFEVGFKASPASGFTLNGAGFYYDYRNLQVTSLQTINNLLTQRLTNAAKVRTIGAELSGALNLAEGLKLSFGVSYLDSEYSSFANAVFTTPTRLLTNPATQCLPPYTPGQQICSQTADVSGKRAIRSPKLSGNVSAEYGVDTGLGRFTLAGTLFLTSKIFFDPNNRIVQSGYEKLNLSLAWEPVERVALRVWGKNLTGSDSLASLVASTSYDAVTYEPRRSFGVDLSFRY